MHLRRSALALALGVLLLGQGDVLHGADSLDQSTRVAALAKVWGLLKYYHPLVATGARSWDDTLIAELPRVKAAASKRDFNDEILRMINEVGAAPRMRAGTTPDQAEADPAFTWLEDAQLFEPSTIAALKTIRNAVVPSSNRYVKPSGSVPNPDFSTEAPYDLPAFPSEGMRFLGLARFWNMVQYYAPNRDITDRAWADVLTALVPRFLEAADANAYHLAACELTASLNDAHAFTGSATLTALWGTNSPAMRTRFIEEQTVVTDVFDRLSFGADVRPGDVIVDINGVAAADVRARLRKYVWASNEGSLQRNIDALVLRTNAATLTLGVSRFGVRKSVEMRAVALADVFAEGTRIDGLAPKWRTLDGNIGYVNMGLLQQGDVPAMMTALANTNAIVFDVRNYPNGTLYLIAQRLNPAARSFVKFTRPQYDLPGTAIEYLALDAGSTSPNPDYYRGKVILLGDDRTQSQAEFTMMALKTAPNVTIVGSPTAGADGNVSLIALPGGLRTYFSGLGVFYPDGSATQRVGIVPNVFVVPTIAGIQNGVDEVLERALALVR